MKKAFSSLLIVVAVTALTVACKKNDDSGGGGGGTFAATPAQVPAQNCANANNAACTPVNPNYYQQNAPNFINYQWGYSNGYCGCPAGYRPVMNFNWGMSCAPAGWFPSGWYYSAYNTQSFYYGPQNGQWTSIPQVTYSPATSGTATGCGAQASAICDIRNPSSCGSGSTCRQVSGGSNLGLCSSGVGNDNYQAPQQQNNCRTYFNGFAWVTWCSGSYYNGFYGYNYY